MKLTKRFAVVLAALMISASMVACGGTAETSSAPAADPTSSEAAASVGAEMSEEDYKAKILDLYTQTTVLVGEMAVADQTDVVAFIATSEKIINNIKGAYTEMCALVPPATMAAAHANIKEGAEANKKVLDISMKMISLGTEQMTEEEAAAKIAEFQPELEALNPQTAKLAEGLTVVIGADAVNSAAATIPE